MTESTQPTVDPERKKERREAGINAGIGLASICAILGILIWIDLTPLPAQIPFARVGGQTRVETAIEVSRLWPMSGRQAFVPVSVSGKQDAYWSGAECAVGHEAGPLPLILQTNKEPRAAATVRAAAHLGGGPIPDASCARTRGTGAGPCEESNWNVLQVPGEGNHVSLPNWVPECEQLHSTVIFTGAKSANDAPDLAVAMPLARHLSAPSRRVTVVITPPYLEAKLPLLKFLQQSEQTVEGGIVLGGTTRIPEATQNQLVALLQRQEDAVWLQRIVTALGPFGTLLIALLTLVGGWKVAQASTPVAEAVGTGLETRVRPLFKRGNDSGGHPARGAEGSSENQESAHPGSSTTPPTTSDGQTPATDAWSSASLKSQSVRLVLKSGEVLTGILSVEPVELAGIRFLRVSDARFDRTRLDLPEERSSIVLVPWNEVLMIWLRETGIGSDDSSNPIAREDDALAKVEVSPKQY